MLVKGATGDLVGQLSIGHMVDWCCLILKFNLYIMIDRALFHLKDFLLRYSIGIRIMKIWCLKDHFIFIMVLVRQHLYYIELGLDNFCPEYKIQETLLLTLQNDILGGALMSSLGWDICFKTYHCEFRVWLYHFSAVCVTLLHWCWM